MTDTPAEVEAARALVAAYDALNSPEHEAEAESLRQLSLRVSSRVDAFQAAQDRIHGLHAAACAKGTPAAANEQAAQVINGDNELFDDSDIVDLTDMTESYADNDDEFSTSRAAGAPND